MKVAIVTVDLQYEFLDPSSATVGRTQKAICLPGVRRLVRHARNEGWTIVHVATSHSSEDTLPLHLQRQGVDDYLSGLRIIQKSAGSVLGVDDLVATGPPAWRGLARAGGASTDKWEGWYLSQVERLQELDESGASLDLIGFAREIEALLE